MDRGALVWIGIAVLALVFLDLLAVEVRRIVREGARLARRLSGYADLPLFDRVAAGSRDLGRIIDALVALAALLERGRQALATLRAVTTGSPRRTH